MSRFPAPLQSQLLGGLSSRTFLARHWQKKPLLIRQALPEVTGLLSRQELFALACDEDVESRLVARQGKGWTLDRGPFRMRELKRRRPLPWTVLVQGVNLFVPIADQLLRRFSFIPYARLDDLMVSYATGGGGVGPHFDSYDVFLLQGMGRRRWRVGRQRDLTLIEGAPLSILRNFRPTQELLLEPGDMLYLPPQYAHEGTAEGECMTYSIGFRAPSAQELIIEFLAFLQERLNAKGRFHDPDLALQAHPAAISDEMIDCAVRMIGQLKWNRAAVSEFLGCFLTELKPQVYFSPPVRPQSLVRFRARCRRTGISLDAKTQLLFRRSNFFLNGEALVVPVADRAMLRRLADDRCLDELNGLSGPMIDLLYRWYRCGYLTPSR